MEQASIIISLGMNGVLGNVIKAILGRRQPVANGMNLVVNHSPGAGSIARVAVQSTTTVPRMPNVSNWKLHVDQGS